MVPCTFESKTVAESEAMPGIVTVAGPDTLARIEDGPVEASKTTMDTDAMENARESVASSKSTY